MERVAIINGKRVAFNFDVGDHIRRKEVNGHTGKVAEVHGAFIDIDWDESCKGTVGRYWSPNSIERFPI